MCVCCCVFNSLSRSSRLASNYSVWQTPGHKTTSGASRAPVANEAAWFFLLFSCTGSSSTMAASESLPRVGRGEPGSDRTPTVSSSLSTTVGDAGEDAGKDSADASSAAQRWAARAPQAADNESDAMHSRTRVESLERPQRDSTTSVVCQHSVVILHEREGAEFSSVWPYGHICWGEDARVQ